MIPYTTIPFVSAFFLVFVGVLIGHFIWYRYRDEQENLADDLRRKIHELNSSLSIQTREFTDANQQIVELRAELEGARQENSELSESLGQREELYESVAADLEKSESINVELQSELEQQAQLRISAESENVGAKQHAETLEATLGSQKSEVEAALTQQRQLQERAEQAESSLMAQKQENDALIESRHEQLQRIAECEALIEQLQAGDHEATDHDRQMDAVKAEVEQWRQQCRDVETELATVQSRSDARTQELQEKIDQLQSQNESLKSGNDEYAVELSVQIERSQELSAKIGAALEDLGRLQLHADEAQALREDRDRLIDELDERQNEIHCLREQAVASQDDQAVRDELERARVEQDGLQEQLLDFKNKKAELEGEIREHARRRESLERALADANEEIAQLQIDRERLEGVDDEVVELDSKHRNALSELKQAKVEREQALIAESSTREIVIELRTELSERLDSIRALEKQKDDAIAALEEESGQQEQLASDFTRISEQCELLEKQYAASQHAQSQQAQELAEVNEELGQIQAYYEQSRAQVRLYQQRLSDLEDLMSEQQGNRSPQGKTLTPSASPKSAFSFRKVQRRDDVVRADENIKLRSDHLLGKLYTAPPLRSDDLTAIRGVDAAIHDELNSLGVYTFAQVMEWDHTCIAEFGNRLGNNRIAEQDWVGQARRLYHRQQRSAA